MEDHTPSSSTREHVSSHLPSSTLRTSTNPRKVLIHRFQQSSAGQQQQNSEPDVPSPSASIISDFPDLSSPETFLSLSSPSPSLGIKSPEAFPQVKSHESCDTAHSGESTAESSLGSEATGGNDLFVPPMHPPKVRKPFYKGNKVEDPPEPPYIRRDSAPHKKPPSRDEGSEGKGDSSPLAKRACLESPLLLTANKEYFTNQWAERAAAAAAHDAGRLAPSCWGGPPEVSSPHQPDFSRPPPLEINPQVTAVDDDPYLAEVLRCNRGERSALYRPEPLTPYERLTARPPVLGDPLGRLGQLPPGLDPSELASIARLAMEQLSRGSRKPYDAPPSSSSSTLLDLSLPSEKRRSEVQTPKQQESPHSTADDLPHQVPYVGGSGLKVDEQQICQVCGDIAAGFHCGAYVCEACKVSLL